MRDQIYLVEFTDTDPVPNTYRFGSSGYNTLPTDIPSNAHYAPRVQQPGLVRRDLFAGGAAFGSTQVGYGEITLANTDGALDFMVDKSFGDRPVYIKFGEAGSAYPTFVTILQATIEQVEVTTESVTLRVKDRQYVLDKPLQQSVYAGNNILPNGTEGTATDIKGQRKPKMYGQVLNVHATLVNSSLLTFQMNSGYAVPSNVYDQGVALTFGTDYADLASLEAATVSSGHYSTCVALGLFRLGSNHVGEVTFDAATASGTHALADILSYVASDAGSTVYAPDVTALKALNSAVGGVYFQDSSVEADQGTTTLQVLDQIAQSLGAWYGFDQTGLLRCGRVDAPSGAPVAEFHTSNIISLEKVIGSDDLNGLPVWKVNLRYRKNYQVQNDSDLAGGVAVIRRAELAQAYRTAVAQDTSVKVQYLNAKELTRETLMTDPAEAQAEADRLLSLLKVRKDSYSVVVRWTDELSTLLDIGKVVRVTFPRFGLTTGKLLLITGLTMDLQRKRAEISLWG